MYAIIIILYITLLLGEGPGGGNRENTRSIQPY